MNQLLSPPKSDRSAVLYWVWNVLCLLAAAAGVTAMMLLLAIGPKDPALFFGYFSHPLIFFLNFLPVALLMFLGWALFGRVWCGYLLGAVPVCLFAVGNFFKLAFRNDPVLFADLLLLGEVADMAGKYSLFWNTRLVLLPVCVLAGLVFLLLLARGKPKGKVRLGLLAALLLLAGLGAKPYLDAGLYQKTAGNLVGLNQWSATDQYLSRGSLYPFLYSIREAIRIPPEGYDEDEAEAILAQYEDVPIPEGQQVNVVSIMLEAFADFSKFEGIEFNQDVYALYHALEAESYTGNLMDNIFAGGTVNTEQAFLTGMSTLYNWRSEVSSYPFYFKAQGYETSGDHPCYEWFYNRENVNRYLGFDSYRFTGNHYGAITGGIAMDDVFFPELTADLLDRLDSGVPQFSYSLTYQGHGPYDSEVCWWGEVDDFVENRELDQASRTILANYLGSVQDTQAHLGRFVEELRQREEPVVLILFGDHKPWMGNSNSVYSALGINLDLSTQEGFYNYWSTRYLIWANDAAKEVLDFDFSGEGPDLSPCFLMGHLFDRLGWAGDRYTQATRAIREEITVLHDSGRYVTGGTFTSALTPEQQELLRTFRMLEYHRAR